MAIAQFSMPRPRVLVIAGSDPSGGAYVSWLSLFLILGNIVP